MHIPPKIHPIALETHLEIPAFLTSHSTASVTNCAYNSCGKRRKMRMRLEVVLLFLCLQWRSFAFASAIDGKVVELDASNFDAVISSFDHVLVDFYAPWCGHCKRLSPVLDEAAVELARLKAPVVVAKLDADKYRKLGDKYEIPGFPTLKIFVHGVPTDYHGPRKSEPLVRFLRKFTAPDVAILDSDSAINEFVKAAETHFPIFIGFGVNESVISNIAVKYKNKAWFSVAHGFSDSIMEYYDFDKVPALMSLHPQYDERNIFYGPFDDEDFLEEFVKQGLFPLCVPINADTLKLLKDDERRIALTFVDDENDESSRQLVKLLKAAASANRDLMFGYAGLKQFPEFVQTFGIDGKSKLPQIVVWDGNEEYFTVNGSESIDGEDKGSRITRFLQEYKGGRTVSNKIGLSFMAGIDSFFIYRLIFTAVFVVAMLVLILTIGKHDEEDPPRVRSQESGDQLSSSSSRQENKAGEKED